MEQLIKCYQDKSDEDCQDKIAIHLKQIQNLQDYCNEYKSYIEECIIDTWNELDVKYNEYLQDNTKNVISIQGEYYKEFDDKIFSKYRQRTLHNWIEYNQYQNQNQNKDMIIETSVTSRGLEYIRIP